MMFLGLCVTELQTYFATGANATITTHVTEYFTNKFRLRYDTHQICANILCLDRVISATKTLMRIREDIRPLIWEIINSRIMPTTINVLSTNLALGLFIWLLYGDATHLICLTVMFKTQPCLFSYLPDYIRTMMDVVSIYFTNGYDDSSAKWLCNQLEQMAYFFKPMAEEAMILDQYLLLIHCMDFSCVKSEILNAIPMFNFHEKRSYYVCDCEKGCPTKATQIKDRFVKMYFPRDGSSIQVQC